MPKSTSIKFVSVTVIRCKVFLKYLCLEVEWSVSIVKGPNVDSKLDGYL